MKTNTKIGLILVSLVSLLLFPGQPSVRADDADSGGVQQGVQVRETWRIHQNKYDTATDLHFKLWQKEDNINVNGWEVEVSHFTSLSSQRGNQPEPQHSTLKNLPGLPKTDDPDNGQHAVDVTASGANIAYCTWVTVKAKFWLTHWNTKRIEASWTKEAQPEKKAVPKHGWDIDWPKPDPQNLTQYLHPFCITNDDTVDNLNITGLAFNPTMNWYDDLTNITFSSPYPNFTLAPGESWFTNITTLGPLYGGHIYFTYNITGSGIISKDWVDHPVTKPCVAEPSDLPNPLTVSFSASVSEGTSYSLNVVPNATIGSVISQFSRPWMILNQPGDNNTGARFFNMSTASGSISGDLSGSIDFQWNRLDFATPYFNNSDWFITTPTGCGILYINATMTDTILGNLTIVGVADLDYKGTSTKGEGRVMTVESWDTGLTTAPDRVLIGDVSYTISGTTITGTFDLRNYSKTPVGLEGRVNTTQEYLLLEGQLKTDEEDWITNETVRFSQYSQPPVDAGVIPGFRIVLEEMAPGREVNQTITAGDMGVGGTISLMRTGVLEVYKVSGQDVPQASVTATRTIENNWGSDMSATMGGIARTIVLVDMSNFTLTTGVDQRSYTIMPSYSEGYECTGYYAGFESYVVPDTHISLSLYLKGIDYRYVLMPTPVVSSVSPVAGYPNDSFQATINGKWFLVNTTFHPLTIDFGAGITADWQNCTVVSDTEVKVNITIAGGAATGPRDVSVKKRGQTGTLVDGFGVGAGINGHVDLQSRPAPPNAQWAIPIEVRFFQGASQVRSANVTLDQNGNFSVGGLANGTYDIGVKSPLTASRLNSSIAVTGITVVDFGTLLSGDVNDGRVGEDPDYISLGDYTRTVTAYDSVPASGNWNIACDFNVDSYVGLDDYTLAVTNYDTVGEMYGM